jgi:hypothetical protein
MAPYAQAILFFYCRPCADYHPKTHPHYAEMFARKAERTKKKAAKERQTKEQHQRG